MKNKIRGYYFITDESLSRQGIIKDVRDAVECGVTVVQYRNKDGTTREMYEEALILRKICRKSLFLINDRIDIALAVNANGVHLGQDDMPCSIARRLLGKNRIIGVTAHNIKEAKEAENAGADYLGVSPIFETSTKSDAGKPAGIDLIKRIKKIVRVPVIAIGGINLSNAEEVIKSGADGLCAISAVVTKDNVKVEIKKFQKLFK